ncbi:TPA: TerC family protein [Bacillus cereus]|uniref:TerC family protein n=1 Tax=Bacillus TaxID=1386 RepID=UPI00032E4E99|nr:TerC family protein [Bacillus cereus]EOO44166.1 YjbE family integral membrane protein [Bacillus cereus BAG1X2-2]EOP00435.1 YjbE family integral membrane protein [Bacillus cereus BAG2O-1]
MTTEIVMALLSIILIDIVLSGDNAVVIALACRNLPEKLRKKAVIIGCAGAIGLRIALTFLAVYLLEIPYVQFVGGLMLLWIAVKLLKGEEDSQIEGGNTIWSAIKTIIVADFVMSLDNVVAVAGVANGHTGLLVIGLLVSIPLIVWGSQILIKLMERFPIIVAFGSALLGYTAGTMMMHDKVIGGWITENFANTQFLPILMAVAVVVIGKLENKRSSK